MKKIFYIGCAVAMMAVATSCNNGNKTQSEDSAIDSAIVEDTTVAIETVATDTPEAIEEPAPAPEVTKPVKNTPKPTGNNTSNNKKDDTNAKPANDGGAGTAAALADKAKQVANDGIDAADAKRKAWADKKKK